MTTITKPNSQISVNSELERLFGLQTNDEKIGEIKGFLRNENTKKHQWSRDEYYKLIRLIESCESQFHSKDGRIERDRITQLINSISSIKWWQIHSTQRQQWERVQRVLGQSR